MKHRASVYPDGRHLRNPHDPAQRYHGKKISSSRENQSALRTDLKNQGDARHEISRAYKQTVKPAVARALGEAVAETRTP